MDITKIILLTLVVCTIGINQVFCMGSKSQHSLVLDWQTEDLLVIDSDEALAAFIQRPFRNFTAKKIAILLT